MQRDLRPRRQRRGAGQTGQQPRGQPQRRFLSQQFGHARLQAVGAGVFAVLIVSDRPLHGELKLPGMASEFYQSQADRHLEVGIQAINIMRDLPTERLHSRKLRSFNEVPFQ